MAACDYVGLHAPWFKISHRVPRSRYVFCLQVRPKCAAGPITPPVNPPASPTPVGSPPRTPPPTASPPPSTGGGAGVGAYLSQAQFDAMFPLINSATGLDACTGKGFFTYNGFKTAAASFPGLFNSGDAVKNKVEIGAFLAQASQETNGAGEGQTNGGLCFVEEGGKTPPLGDYCSPSPDYPCGPGQTYIGRGPLQVSYNYNYIPAGRAVGFDGLNNPRVLATDEVLSWKASMFFWMTAVTPKPSCHAIMQGTWVPSADDVAKGRKTSSFGACTNVINGGVLQCGQYTVPNPAEQKKIDYFNAYTNLLGVPPGNDVSCKTQLHY